MAETEPEVAGRIYQSTVRFQDRMTDLFRLRFGYPPGSLEPRVLAAAMTASWFVAVYGFEEVAATDPDPPSTDALGLQSLEMFTSGLGHLVEHRLSRSGAPHPLPVGAETDCTGLHPFQPASLAAREEVVR